MTSTTVSKEREAFEQWARNNGLSARKLTTDSYYFGNTDAAWRAWQARARQAIASADEGISARSVRPLQCPNCGKKITPHEQIVRVGKGPYTCEVCDGVIE